MDKILLCLVVGVCFLGCSIAPEIEDTVRPDEMRFTQKVVADGLEEPLQLEFDRQGYIYWIERTGGVKRIHESDSEIKVLGELPVYEGRAPGLIGILLDKDFDNSRNIYLYYSAAEDEGDLMRLSRFTLGANNELDMDSEVILLEIPWEQPDGSHIGGGMTWDEAGNLYLAVGGDTQPSEYYPIHYFEEDSSYIQDAARTAGNTNDLRGAILRIKPQTDGSYTIPEGNLFEGNLGDTRPEIYTMGNRNPWRLSIDSQTGHLHWGEVGPDGGQDSDEYGPMGYDELNVAKEAGNFGWPFAIGDNRTYPAYNYQDSTFKDPMDPDSMINNSPLNTGLQELPPAQPALISYPYGVSDEWPLLSSGARSVVGGPVFRSEDFSSDAPRVFPDYYEGKWFVTDYVRNWIMVVTMNEERTEATSVERFLPSVDLSHKQPLDMDFSPAGDLYLVEYGVQGRISRIEYNDGNIAPVAEISAPKTTGSTPFEVQLSANGSMDHDGDDLQYEWRVEPASGGTVQRYDQENPAVTLEKPAHYNVVLEVMDDQGALGVDSIEVVAGNNRPEVEIMVTRGNSTFYFPGDDIEYHLKVNDEEDGALADGDLDPENIRLTAEYMPSVISRPELEALTTQQTARDKTPLKHLQTRQLIVESNCETCHAVQTELVGPSFKRVSARYKEATDAKEQIMTSIMEGSEGKWGDTPMPPNMMLNEGEVEMIAEFILSLEQRDTLQQQLSFKGEFVTSGHEKNGGTGRVERFFEVPHERGAYVLSASYVDEGHEKVDGLHLQQEDYLLLRYPLLAPEKADYFSEKGISFTPSTDDPGFIVSGQKPHIGFKEIDLTGLKEIQVGALTRYWHWSHFIGANVELRLGSPTGTLVDQPKEQFPSDSLQAEDGPFFGEDWDDPVSIDVSGIEGVHDIFLVFSNSEAGDNDALLILTGIQFLKN